MHIDTHEHTTVTVTYDLLGLSLDEVTFLRDMLGKFSSTCSPDTQPHVHRVLYEMLARALPDFTRWELKADGGYNNPALFCVKRKTED